MSSADTGGDLMVKSSSPPYIGEFAKSVICMLKLAQNGNRRLKLSD